MLSPFVFCASVPTPFILYGGLYFQVLARFILYGDRLFSKIYGCFMSGSDFMRKTPLYFLEYQIHA